MGTSPTITFFATNNCAYHKLLCVSQTIVRITNYCAYHKLLCVSQTIVRITNNNCVYHKQLCTPRFLFMVSFILYRIYKLYLVIAFSSLYDKCL